MSRTQTRMRRKHYEKSWRERWEVFKHNRLKPSCWELIAYGILLNVIGAGCLLLKAIIDKGNTEAMIHQKLEAHGTGIKPTEEEKQKGPHVEISSVLVVIVTMTGRMANVVGTMKLYKGLGKFFSDRKRKKFRKATERVQNGETEVEITELFADCCQCF